MDGDLARTNIVTLEQHAAFDARIGDLVGKPVEAAQQARFPRSARPDQRRDAARRHIERLLASIPDGPSRVEYFELLGREASARAIEVEVEIGEAQRGQHRAIEHAVHERFPGVITSWQADTLTARSPGYAELVNAYEQQGEHDLVEEVTS